MIDLLVYIVGYEERSGFVANSNNIAAKARLALVFESYRECWFHRNLEAAHTRGDLLLAIEADRAHFLTAFEHAIRAAIPNISDVPSTIGIDVSSMTRDLMSDLLRYLFDMMPAMNLNLVFLYSTAKYQEPPGDDGPYVDFHPIAGCEGWTLHPERPLSAVLGLGYEADQAIGTVEYLDPSGIWAFVPNGEDPRFRRDLDRANGALWPILEPSHKIEYRIANPHSLYTDLRGLTEVLARRSRVILVPGGPKIFSAISLLVKLEIGDEVSVWRASSHGFRTIRNVEASGSIARFDYPQRRLIRSTDDDDDEVGY